MSSLDIGAMERGRDIVGRALDSDLFYSFRRSRLVMAAAGLTLLFVLAALFAPLITPQNPYDPAVVIVLDAFSPPSWHADGRLTYILGTDDQGRDLYSAMVYGLRMSLLVGFSAVALAMVAGVGLGLIAGYVGGAVGALAMRLADIQLTFPGVLVVLLVSGIVRGLLPSDHHTDYAVLIVVAALAFGEWPQFARTVRGAVLVERDKDYVQAARVIGRGRAAIMLSHVLPNVMGPVLVIATVSLAGAIIGEAILSFLGIGMPPNQPSLGRLVYNGGNFLYSGEWWIALFPGAVLALLVLAVNLLGDWLRDALNPRLRTGAL